MCSQTDDPSQHDAARPSDEPGPGERFDRTWSHYADDCPAAPAGSEPQPPHSDARHIAGYREDCPACIWLDDSIAARPSDETGAWERRTYEEWVGVVADAIHETCRLEWQAIVLVDPKRQFTQHATDAHYGMAHDLVRRLNLAANQPEPTRGAEDFAPPLPEEGCGCGACVYLRRKQSEAYQARLAATRTPEKKGTTE